MEAEQKLLKEIQKVNNGTDGCMAELENSSVTFRRTNKWKRWVDPNQ